jgi:hypothetical protein
MSENPKPRPELTATDKALIVYYAFIFLSDSVSATAIKTIGQPWASDDIQRFFAKRAIDALIVEGLLDANKAVDFDMMGKLTWLETEKPKIIM